MSAQGAVCPWGVSARKVYAGGCLPGRVYAQGAASAQGRVSAQGGCLPDPPNVQNDRHM